MDRFVSRRRLLSCIGGLSTAMALSGCSGGGDGGDTSDTDTPEPTLSIGELVFCDSQPEGYDDYTVRDGATYSVEETIWVYIDVLNLGSESTGDDKVAIELSESLEVTGPSGETILDDVLELDNEFGTDVDLRTYFIVNDIHLPSDASAGEYEVSVTLDDEISGETASASGTFTAEPSG